MKKLIYFALTCVLLLSACDIGAQSAKPDASPENPDSQSLSLIDLDAWEKSIATTYVRPEYTEDRLIELAKEKDNKDSMKVLENFVQNELKSNIYFVDSVDGSYNPKRMTVGTVDGNVYSFELVRYHKYEGIWVVSSYAKYDNEEMDLTVQYEEIDPEDVEGAVQEIDPEQAEGAVQDWVKIQTAKKQRSQEYLLVNEKVYILLTANEGESVELLDIRGNHERIIVSHGNSALDTERYGEKPFILLQVNSPIFEIKFNQYNKVQTAHPSLYIP